MRKLLTLIYVIFVATLSIQAQHPDTAWAKVDIPPLIITEYNGAYFTQYLELTNVGDEVIDLTKFSIANVFNQSTAGYHPDTRYFGTGSLAPRIHHWQEGETLAPGETYLFMKVNDLALSPTYPTLTRHIPEMVAKADYFLYSQDGASSTNLPYVYAPEYEAWGFDSVAPRGSELTFWEFLHNRPTPFVLMYYYEREYYNQALDSTYMVTDSLIADCFGMSIRDDGSKFGAYTAIAGVPDANGGDDFIVARKADVFQGTADWETSRGVTSDDSEWMVVPSLVGRKPFTTYANHGNFTVDLKPKEGSIIYEATNTISVPWQTRKLEGLIRDGIETGDGVSWEYNWSPSLEDSAYIRVRVGDIVTFRAFGVELDERSYNFEVQEPETDLAIALPKLRKNDLGWYSNTNTYYNITDDDPEMDTIRNVSYQTSIDTLFKYIEIPPAATAEIIFVDEDTSRVEVVYGDILRVVSEDMSTTKDYFIKVDEYIKSDNAMLAVISFPDYSLDDYYWDWEVLRQDTLPDFLSNKYNYTMMVSKEREAVPALVAKAVSINSTVNVKRATDLDGGLEARTTVFEVVAESDTSILTYSVTFERDMPPEFIQPVTGEPFVSEAVTGARTNDDYVEFFNPTSSPIDMSDYLFCTLEAAWTSAEQALTTSFKDLPYPSGTDFRKLNIPGRVYDTARWAAGERGFFKIDAAVNTVIKPGDVFVSGVANPSDWREMEYISEVDQNRFDPKTSNAERMVKIDRARGYALFRILNDSIKNGTKAVGADISDYKLVDYFHRTQEALDTSLNYFVLAGTTMNNRAWYMRRKARVQKGMLERGGGISPDIDSADWILRSDYAYLIPEAQIGYDVPGETSRDGLGSHDMDPITSQSSNISSPVYVVTPGYLEGLSVKGVSHTASVDDFYANITKGDPDQTLTVHNSGTLKTGTDILAEGDTLTVASADNSNFSHYTIMLGELNADVSLYEVAGFDVEVSADNTISGFGYDVAIADVLAGVECNALSYINVIDQENNLVPLITIRYKQNLDEFDEMELDIVDSKVFDGLVFEVVAENGDKGSYMITPDADSLMITSNYLHVVQDSLSILSVPYGLTTSSFLNYLYVPEGATMKVYNKAHYERMDGIVKTDDYVEAKSADGSDSISYVIYFIGQSGTKGIDDGNEGSDTTSIAPFLAGSLSSVYPNPATDILYIDRAPEGSIIQVISLSGTMVHSQRATEELIEIPLSGWDRGMYLIRIVEKEGATSHKVVIM